MFSERILAPEATISSNPDQQTIVNGSSFSSSGTSGSIPLRKKIKTHILQRQEEAISDYVSMNPSHVSKGSVL